MKRTHLYRALELIQAALVEKKTTAKIYSNAMLRYDKLYGFGHMQRLLPKEKMIEVLDMVIEKMLRR